MADIPRPKRDWPDDHERQCDGALVTFSTASRTGGVLAVSEMPKQVIEFMNATNDEAMIELHHYNDPEVQVYVRNGDIVAVDARWIILSP